MSARELDAAGITGRELRRAYERCRRINARHGRTYYLAGRLLPPRARPATHALYGFARSCDEIVDNPAPGSDPAAALELTHRRLDTVFGTSTPADPVLAALADTVRRHALPREYFDAFLSSMRMDTEITGYADFTELREYTYGSAGVIGLQMLPVLGTVDGAEADAAPAAVAAGEAFQLTNFLRDIGEDLQRGRVYLPESELAAYGVDRELLRWCVDHGGTDRRVRAALAALVARNRAIYRRARPGIDLLRPESRPCMRTALTLYEGILDEIEAAGYDVLGHRVVVGRGRRLRVAAGALLTGSRPA